MALEREDGPVALLLSRQNIPVLDRSEVAPRRAGCERGGYVLWDSPRRTGSTGATAPELILIATGAEVAPTLAGRRGSWPSEGTRVRVVSMPCMELFEAQTQEYRDEVLPPAVTRAAGGRARRDA